MIALHSIKNGSATFQTQAYKKTCTKKSGRFFFAGNAGISKIEASKLALLEFNFKLCEPCGDIVDVGI